MFEEEIPLSQHDQLAMAIAQGKSIAEWAQQNGVPRRTAQRQLGPCFGTIDAYDAEMFRTHGLSPRVEGSVRFVDQVRPSCTPLLGAKTSCHGKTSWSEAGKEPTPKTRRAV